MSDVDEYISKYDDWRGWRLAELRALINETDPELKEGFKWSVPVWQYNGLVCAISAFKDHVKINFFKAALFDRTNSLLNSGLDSKEHRSINLAKNDKIDVSGLRELVKTAAAYNK